MNRKRWVNGKGWVPENDLTPEDIDTIEKHRREIDRAVKAAGDPAPRVKRRRHGNV